MDRVDLRNRNSINNMRDGVTQWFKDNLGILIALLCYHLYCL